LKSCLACLRMVLYIMCMVESLRILFILTVSGIFLTLAEGLAFKQYKLRSLNNVSQNIDNHTVKEHGTLKARNWHSTKHSNK